VSDDTRKTDLAKIHIARQQLCLDDESYRAMLWTIARVESAKDLDAAGRRAVLDHLRSRGFKPRKKARTTPSYSRKALVKKIQALMLSHGFSDDYIDGMARKMFQVDRYEWCEPGQLWRLVAALNYHIKRQEGRA